MFNRKSINSLSVLGVVLFSQVSLAGPAQEEFIQCVIKNGKNLCTKVQEGGKSLNEWAVKSADDFKRLCGIGSKSCKVVEESKLPASDLKLLDEAVSSSAPVKTIHDVPSSSTATAVKNQDLRTFGTTLELKPASRPDLLKATGATQLKEVVPTTDTKGKSFFDKFMAKLGLNAKLAKEQAVKNQDTNFKEMKVYTADDIKGNIDGKAFVDDGAMAFDKQAKEAMEEKKFFFDPKTKEVREPLNEKEAKMARLPLTDKEKEDAAQYEMNLICAACPPACPVGTKGVKGEIISPKSSTHGL